MIVPGTNHGNRFINLIGKKFGKLTVLRLGKRTPAGAIRWICLCECGGKSLTTSQGLRASKTKSCGCLRISAGGGLARRIRPYESLYNILVSRCKKGAVHARNGGLIPGRQVRKVMSYKAYLTFTKITECHYCGGTIVWAKYNASQGPGCNLDRMNNEKGYSKRNCVVCCGPCNAMKSTMAYGAFLDKITQIAKKHRRKR